MLDSRNVRDKYKTLSNEEIVADLQKNSLPIAVLMQTVKREYNFGCIVRNANNFAVSEVFYYGEKHFDRRASVCTYIYTPVKFLSSFDQIVQLKEKYVFVGAENNIAGTVQLNKFVWPKQPVLLVLGEEGLGISPELMKLLDYTVEIPQNGSTRSINVASAAAICLYDYSSKLCA
jgi:tRNA G18 (ribose-2'-O)-methylase SpoU